MRSQLIDILEAASHRGYTTDYLVSKVVDLNDAYGCEGMEPENLADLVVYLSSRADNDIDAFEDDHAAEITRLIIERS